MSGIFISWTRENGRTRDLASELGLEAVHIYSSGRFGLPGRYVRQARETRRVLRERAPKRVALMLPPAPALLALLGRLRPGAGLVVDAHTGFFLDPKWRWAAGWSLRLVRRMGATAIVTNDHLRDLCSAAGVRAIVLQDPILEHAPAASAGHVLCPLSYANDEPVDEILEAARSTPEIDWVLTGRAPEAVRERAPANVRFSGFVDDAEYARLLTTAGAVAALTTRPHTMQRAGYEAFHEAVPQLTSDFPELRGFYEDSARYADPDPASIASELRALLRERERFVERTLEVRALRAAEQRAALDEVRTALGGRPRTPGPDDSEPDDVEDRNPGSRNGAD